jgi:Zn-dependent protease with chaperone function
MNFFQQQDRARSKSRNLIFLFFLSVCLIIFLINLIFILAVKGDPQDWTTYLTISLVTLIFIISCSLFKKWQLSSGGKAVAESLNGVLLNSYEATAKQKRLLNVVEEMAIASGVSVPPVYLINEKGINAFAAGFSTEDAVIGITNGAIENLNREELQGVIAHEFSHILNGDMRINIKIASVLFGILGVSTIGRIILRSGSSRSNSKSQSGLAAIGLGLFLTGLIGVLFGKLIQASLSRQREYLADASAVQFTRNPLGISGALKRIGFLQEGSTIKNVKSEQFSHMFFSGISEGFFSNFFRTHPHLNERILAIEPNWNGEFEMTIDVDHQEEINDQTKVTNKLPSSFAFSALINQVNNIGIIDEKSIVASKNLINQIPQNIKDEIVSPFGARAVIYSFLITPNFEKEQLDLLAENADPQVFKLTCDLFDQISKLDFNLRLPIIEMAINTLKLLSFEQFKIFRKNIILLVNADSQISFSEWSLMKIILSNLESGFKHELKIAKPKINTKNINNSIGLFLSLFANYHTPGEAVAKNKFEEAINKIASLKGNKLEFTAHKNIKIEDLDTNIEILKKLKPRGKERFIKLAIGCMDSNEISAPQRELLRAICAVIGCPMPLVGISNP